MRNMIQEIEDYMLDLNCIELRPNIFMKIVRRDSMDLFSADFFRVRDKIESAR